MAGRPEDELICPTCQTRNRARWEFCVRCGEPLQDVTPTPASAPKPTGSASDFEATEQMQDTGEAGMVLFVGVLALVLLTVVACSRLRDTPPPPGPSPDLFTLGTQPPNLPAPQKAPDKAGAGDFEEGRRRLAGGDAAGAIPFLTRAVDADPGSAAFRDALGQALAATGAPDRAFEQYAEAARLDRAQFGMKLGERLADAGRNEEA